MTKTQTTRKATLADVQEGDIVFKFGKTVSAFPLIVSRVDHHFAGTKKAVTLLRYDHGGFTLAHPSTTPVVLSVHTAERV